MNAGPENCTICPEGTYANSTNSSECTSCPRFMTTNGPGMTSMDNCSKFDHCL